MSSLLKGTIILHLFRLVCLTFTGLFSWNKNEILPFQGTTGTLQMKEAARFCSENCTWVSEGLVCVLNSAADLPTLFDLELLKTIYYFLKSDY